MEAVDVLVGIDPQQYRVGIDIGRQRQLDEDAVDRGVGVEPIDQRDQLGLAHACGKPVLEALEPRLERRLDLRADIDRARRVLADQHYREPRRAAGPLAERRAQRRHAGAQPGREGLSVDQFGSHRGEP